MKLPLPARDLQRDLDEFDIWITPSLGEITDTEKFREEQNRVTLIFEELGQATGNFRDAANCSPGAIASTFTAIASARDEAERAELFKSLASTLYLVTGKSDNNAKCQFPLYLRDFARWDSLPKVTRRKGGTSITQTPLPRTIKSDDFMELIAQVGHGDAATRLLSQFIAFLLQGEDAVRQFWSLGFSYFALKALGQGYERNLLAPIIIFKVRGSVSASGGHQPEVLLRGELERWGLVGGEDFNLADVVVDDKLRGGNEKSRAFDFVLPYRTAGWAPEWQRRIMMQSQFYAGDSGSVSHKNVDQTTSSRKAVRQRFADARFVEYVDGAGYFSSLNGDLKKILAMPTTSSFIQIRSAAIRLRRELQALGFVTPLEIEHAVVQSTGDVDVVAGKLFDQGYKRDEVKRAIAVACRQGTIKQADSKLRLQDHRRDIVRQHLLLDTLCQHGRVITPDAATPISSVLVPGFGPFFGMELDQLARYAIANAGQMTDEVSHSQTFASDIKALLQRGQCMVGR